MQVPKTVIQILNTSLAIVAEFKSFYPLNERGFVLRYSQELSSWGGCTFRIATEDPALSQWGDVLKPHAYHVRVKRGQATVWQGAIVDNPERNKDYIEVRAVEYLFYLDRILIRRDADKPETDEDESNFKTFSSGTMSSAVSTLISNAASDFGSGHILSSMTAGTIENPNYPDNFVQANGTALTGAWSFSSDVTLTFDYHTAFYVLQTFGFYSRADFRLNTDLSFDFKKFIGDKNKNLTFMYTESGSNIVNYNVPRLGQRQLNHIIGIAADDEGKILHDDKAGRDSASIGTYGLLQGSQAFADVKSRNPLASRLSEQVRLVRDPEESPINLILNEKSSHFGKYGIGDLVRVRIKDHIIDYNKTRRIVGFTTNLHNTGRELTSVQTNIPNQKDVGA